MYFGVNMDAVVDTENVSGKRSEITCRVVLGECKKSSLTMTE